MSMDFSFMNLGLTNTFGDSSVKPGYELIDEILCYSKANIGLGYKKLLDSPRWRALLMILSILQISNDIYVLIEKLNLF